VNAAAFDGCDAEDLAEAIDQVAALEAAVRSQLLALISAFGATRAWEADGAASVEAWLMMRLGVARRTATELVRVAGAVPQLPTIAAAYADGRLSWDQLAAVTRFATPDTDAALAPEAVGLSAAELERAAQRARMVSAAETAAVDRRRGVGWRWSADDGSLRLWGRLAPADGMVVATTLGRLADQAPPDPATGVYEPYESRCADALVELASCRLAADADADRATVVVHVDTTVARGSVEGAPAVAASTLRRLACDARLQVVTHSTDASVIGVGRTTRQVPPWLMRLLRRRDGGCRFPGCDRQRWVHAHHIHHWADGGATNDGNLVLLCGHHHRVVHEGGWQVRGSPGGRLEFVNGVGRVVWPRPIERAQRMRMAPPSKVATAFAGFGLRKRLP
jgi:Domain of unknown function (DUF222)/HNH endonuclease